MPPDLQDAVDAHYQNLYRFALSLTRSSDDAWDLAQEAFLRLAKKRSSIRSASAVKSWLYTTLYREFLRLARRGSRFDSYEQDEPPLADDGQHAEGIRRSSEAKDVLAALMELKDGYRQVVSLFYLESYSYKEIAEILNIPIGTVMSRLSRGKDMLKSAIDAPAPDGQVVAFPSSQKKPSHG